jgi:hypothetical protein
MMRPVSKKTRKAAAFCAMAAVLVAFCNCSDYFTPWSAFQPSEYDLGSGTFVPEAVPVAVPDSICSGNASSSPVWYSFPALKDTTYCIVLYPRFGNAVLDIFDTASQSSIASVADTSASLPVSCVWISRRTGTFYLRIRRDSASYGGSVLFPGPFCLSLKSFSAAYGAVIDTYEPDSTRDRAAGISFSAGSNAEVFQIHRLAENDTDWYIFSPNYTRTYVLRTVGNADTRICMTAPANDSVVASDDGSGGGQNALLTWTCPYSTGSYARFFYVTGPSPGVYGISITERDY